jgi:hypothetical protein
MALMQVCSLFTDSANFACCQEDGIASERKSWTSLNQSDHSDLAREVASHECIMEDSYLAKSCNVPSELCAVSYVLNFLAVLRRPTIMAGFTLDEANDYVKSAVTWVEAPE